jgi:hypothetical protein
MAKIVAVLVVLVVLVAVLGLNTGRSCPQGSVMLANSVSANNPDGVCMSDNGVVVRFEQPVGAVRSFGPDPVTDPALEALRGVECAVLDVHNGACQGK